MTLLKKALISTLGEDVKFREAYQYPVSVAFCSVPKERFAEAAKALKKTKAFLSAEWANEEISGLGIFACFRRDSEYLIVKTLTPMDSPSFPSLTKQYLPAYRFERQMHSLMGVVPEGHPDLRPWIKFEDWPQEAFPLRKAFDASSPLPRVKGEYRWARAEGEGVYEIPVGPVHASTIEPGHFRFQAVGENIINLEKRLGYVHKGIEKHFESMTWEDGYRLAGRISGDTTVAHSLAYCMALEAMTGSVPPGRSLWLRALFLERERIANHLGDIGAICNDAAFAFMLYQFMRLKERILRTNNEIFGHRFLMDKVIPGGVAVDITQNGIEKILSELQWLEKEFERLVSIIDDNSSLDDRVRNAGILLPEKAFELCATGIVARASGLKVDARLHNPFPPYDHLEVKVPMLVSGDVHARLWVRVEELRESIRLICELFKSLPDGETARHVPRPIAETAGFAAVEGWRGEIIYWLQSGHTGGINRCMVRDPSSVNWLGLEQAIQGNIVPDFPLCNKSFNQSYSGHDL